LGYWLFCGYVVFSGSKLPNRCQLSFPTNKWPKFTKIFQNLPESSKIYQNLPKSTMPELFIIAVFSVAGMKLYNILTGKDK